MSVWIYGEMLLGGRNHDYSDDERHSTLRHTPVMLTPTLREPRKLTNKYSMQLRSSSHCCISKPHPKACFNVAIWLCVVVCLSVDSPIPGALGLPCLQSTEQNMIVCWFRDDYSRLYYISHAENKWHHFCYIAAFAVSRTVAEKTGVWFMYLIIRLLCV